MLLAMTSTDPWVEEHLLARFLRYVRIDTGSTRHATTSPSSPGQLELARLLVEELQDLGLKAIELNEQGFLVARLPSNLPTGAPEPPEIGLMAHLDTSDAAPSSNVTPRLHAPYDGETIRLRDGVLLDPAEYPELARYRGRTIVTSDGTTLLGADDKAGLAEIMTALEVLVRHPEIRRGPLSVYFTPDEEQGGSMERFPIEKVTARYCYTFDGGEEGTIEAECFEGYKAEILFHGKSIHTGVARGKLANAIEIAAKFLCMLPGAESPQATDGRFGFYFPLEISGTIERAALEMYIRDFEEEEVLRRIDALKTIGTAVEAAFPRGRVEVKSRKQYANMRRFLQEAPEVVGYLEEAIRRTGLEPAHRIIRGGTDGARLSELGIPTPNVFTGGHNYHSRQEWAAVPAMVRAVQTAVNLCALWGEHGKRDRAAPP
jgi:tripeptide aminopeptidase